MGYRIRLGKVPKTAKAKYADKTEAELAELYGESDGECATFYAHSIEEHTQLFELGKYVDYLQNVEPFYDFKLNDTEFVIMSKKGLKNIIEEYHKSTHKYYKEMEADDFADYQRNKVNEWDKDGQFSISPYYLDEPEENCDGFLVKSWKIEYAIFNLVYIYRTFDWENDYLIYSGW